MWHHVHFFEVAAPAMDHPASWANNTKCQVNRLRYNPFFGFGPDESFRMNIQTGLARNRLSTLRLPTSVANISNGVRSCRLASGALSCQTTVPDNIPQNTVSDVP